MVEYRPSDSTDSFVWAFCADSWSVTDRRRYYALIFALVFFFVIHLVAIATIGLLVQPGFDVARPALERAAYISEHTLLWRIGWLPWQLSALSDVIVSLALIWWLRGRGPSMALRWAYLALLLNLIAGIPEQLYELRLVTSHVGVAEAVATERHALLEFEGQQQTALIVTSIWGAGFYLLMTVAWHRALTLAAGVHGWLTGVIGKLLALSLGGLVLATGLVALQVWGGFHSAIAIAVTAGVGFIAVCVWSLAACDIAGRAHHQDGEDAEMHLLRWPNDGPLRWFAGIANSKGLRDGGRVVPFAKLKSDIEDVVYLNWLVPTEDAQRVLPSPLVCDDLDGYTAVSVLTYCHGGFGPAIYGPFRKLLPSPRQSNWRLYPEPVPADSAPDAIYFFKTALSTWPHVVISRLIADGLPSHYPQRFEHERSGNAVRTLVDPGAGSSPSLRSNVVEHDQHDLPEAWANRFDDWGSAVTYLFDQNRGLQVDGTSGDVRQSTINIPITIDGIRQATIDELEMAGIPPELLIDAANPTLFAFVVPNVPFEATGEGVALSGSRESDHA